MRQLTSNSYLMENPEESLRLDIKTDAEAVRKQALWCGLKPGMRVLDAGCGSGKVSSILYEMIQPGGELVAVDISEERIHFAEQKYGGKPGLKFQVYDFSKPSPTLSSNFDLIWMRLLLEHFKTESMEILKAFSVYLKTNGRFCLMDLDHNALNHYEMPFEIQKTLQKLATILETDFNFDPYAGRKLFSFLYDLGYQNICMHLMPHHLIYGKLNKTDSFNWMKKIEILFAKVPHAFEDYPGKGQAFIHDFKLFFVNPRRFTYTPLILCKGSKP